MISKDITVMIFVTLWVLANTAAFFFGGETLVAVTNTIFLMLAAMLVVIDRTTNLFKPNKRN